MIGGPCDLDAPTVSGLWSAGARTPGICTERQSFCVNQITGSRTNPGCEWSYSKVTCRAVGASGGGRRAVRWRFRDWRVHLMSLRKPGSHPRPPSLEPHTHKQEGVGHHRQHCYRRCWGCREPHGITSTSHFSKSNLTTFHGTKTVYRAFENPFLRYDGTLSDLKLPSVSTESV